MADASHERAREERLLTILRAQIPSVPYHQNIINISLTWR